ncbi:MAG: hypothetical protein GY750_18995 [Lentisphaerae bacterium]|nr:hypothetical protein [Lentisphaerota bacterium]MCP4103486.1 hypothetical protein [Lentisphaerota bacterium]
MTGKPKKQKIIDFSNVRKMPERLPLHWAYVLLFALALCSSLWQHGHPILTLCLLVATFLIGALAYVPYSKIPSNTRFYLQIIIMVTSIIWFFYRAKQHIPLDKILIESVCVAGLCFGTAPN